MDGLRLLTLIFGLLFTTAAALSGAAGLLVTASLFIADRSPRSAEFLGVSLVVSAGLLALGGLLVGIGIEGIGLARASADGRLAAGDRLRPRVTRLLAFLSALGLGFCAVLAHVTYAILARLDQGFAVFG